MAQQNSAPTKNIAVIGLGMTGVSVVHAVLQKVKKGEISNNIKITVFEPRKQLATGPIYDLELPDCCVLNNTTDYMAGLNIKLDNPTVKDFYLWIKNHVEDLQKLYPDFQLDNPSGTVPRSLYGRYLVARWNELTEYAKENHIELNVVHAKNSIQAIRESKVILNGGTQAYDAVFLTTGHWENIEIADFKHAERLVHAPYPLTQYDKIPENSRIAILGASLTACELADYLIEHRHAKHVTLMSTSGRMRSVRGNFRTDYECQYLTPKNIEAQRIAEGGHLSINTIGRLLVQELEHAAGEQINWDEIIKPANPVGVFRKNYEHAKNDPEVKTFSALLSILQIRDQLFAAVRPEDVVTLNDYCNGVFSAYKTPMSLHQAERVLKHIDAKKLDIQGDVPFRRLVVSKEIHFDNNGVSIQGHPYDWMVIGNISALNRGLSKEYQMMIQNGILAQNEIGLVADLSNSRANTQAAVYLIGPEKGFRSGSINNNNEVLSAVNDMCQTLQKQDTAIAPASSAIHKIVAGGPQRRGRERH